MSVQAVFLRSSVAAQDPESQPVARRWLVVEPLPSAGMKMPYAPWDRVVHAQFEYIGPDLLANLDPEIVLAPLITPGWDILDLAAILTEAGFAGTLLARCRALPSIDMVQAEIRDVFPGLEVRIQIVPG